MYGNTYSRKTSKYETLFYRKLNYNPNKTIWFVSRENGYEFEYDTDKTLTSQIILRDYEKRFFKYINKYNL